MLSARILVFTLVSLFAISNSFAEGQSNVMVECHSLPPGKLNPSKQNVKVQATMARDYAEEQIQVIVNGQSEVYINGAMDNFYRFHSIDVFKKFPTYTVAGIASNENTPDMLVPAGDGDLPLVDLRGSNKKVRFEGANEYATFSATLYRVNPRDRLKFLTPVNMACTSKYEVVKKAKPKPVVDYITE